MNEIISNLSLAKTVISEKQAQLKRSIKQYGWTIKTLQVHFILWRKQRFIKKWLKYFLEAEQLAYFWNDTVISFYNNYN